MPILSRTGSDSPENQSKASPWESGVWGMTDRKMGKSPTRSSGLTTTRVVNFGPWPSRWKIELLSNTFSKPMSDPTIDPEELTSALDGIVHFCEKLEQRLSEAEDQINTLAHSGGGFSSATEDVDLSIDGEEIEKIRDSIDKLRG